MKAKKITAVISTFAIMSMAGYALAAWLVNSTGNGYAKVASLAPFTFEDISGSISGTLLPGTNGPLHFRVTNPNTVSLTITTYTPNGGPISSNPGTCPSGNLTTANKNGLSFVVGAGATADISIPNAVTLDGSAPTQCQGVVFTVPSILGATT